ncbi:MAG TPA: hypothetical protein VHJ17_02655 [Thermomonospora sp.]|nr:hypothetical protein [Thermomonospora sp.]
MAIRAFRVITAVGLAGGIGVAVAGAHLSSAAASPTGHVEATGQPRAAEAVVKGDAWVDFTLGREAVRRFTIDVSGHPYKIVNGRFVLGAARGTVTWDHHMLQGPDAGKHFYGTIDVDYVMTGGPVAVISGKARDAVSGGRKGDRVSLTVYDSPQGNAFDRVGFSWGAADPACVPIGLAPAPFAQVMSFDGLQGGYTVKHAELPALDGLTQEPKTPHPCPKPKPRH